MPEVLGYWEIGERPITRRNAFQTLRVVSIRSEMKRKGRKDVVGDVVIRTIYVGGGLWEHVVTEPDYTVWELVDSRWKAMQWHGCHRSYLRFVRQMRNGPRPLVPGVIKKHR